MVVAFGKGGPLFISFLLADSTTNSFVINSEALVCVHAYTCVYVCVCKCFSMLGAPQNTILIWKQDGTSAAGIKVNLAGSAQ